MKKQIYTSIVLVLLALAAVTAATVAWFSIADNTRVRTMSLDIVTDVDHADGSGSTFDIGAVRQNSFI